MHKPIFFNKPIEELIDNEIFQRLLKHNLYYASVGIFYGYPLCCIESFSNGVYASLIYKKFPNHPMDGTGFVPCEKCAQLKINFTEEINKNRISKVSFPNDESSDPDDYLAFFIKLVFLFCKKPDEELKQYPTYYYYFNEALNYPKKIITFKNRLKKQSFDVSSCCRFFNILNEQDLIEQSHNELLISGLQYLADFNNFDIDVYNKIKKNQFILTTI